MSNFFFLCLFLTYFQYIIPAKTILVTGGAGFIGGHVCEFLLARGDRVIIVDNLCGDDTAVAIKKQNLHEIKQKQGSLTIYIADICDKKIMQTIFEKHAIDTVCHLAARTGVRDSIIDPNSFMESNIIGTAVIFELCRIHGVKNIVFASSSSVYGARDNSIPFAETDRTDYQSSPYGMTKKSGELLAAVYYHLYKLPITCLRFFTVYGPRGRRDMAPYLFMDAIYNRKTITVFGDGSAIRDFTYVHDIVEGIVKAIDTPIGFSVINLGSGNPITLINFIAMLEDIIGNKAIVQYEPIILGDVPLTSASTEKAKLLLGYVPRYKIYDGLSSMVTWYKNEQLRESQNTKSDQS